MSCSVIGQKHYGEGTPNINRDSMAGRKILCAMCPVFHLNRRKI